ncbi:restriction endonuclease subunit S [Yersinia pseudotuberculosis]|uniref:restriction endonuclease subunit S n=1 Tax=Yersinia pseudotuberculosis TaxID=633 RepID=UPI0005E79191|nr:restriction endonuclease subunit S [Yersinia pseudotuberculosis]MBO1568013.1 restriction endonuclease subunit S [Yersinia pseudotuberculosis]MBO1591439.1 restriction endonuclease subunit S [Yersinia pseudotuberculosis]MBO1604842.1 restriction endonuclease subunit S [Yersinia pseudotuberculosis]CNE12180.1 restriction modification enzyme [Yersinia pseudotuberculosis]CRY71986.1 restriction modification enzyme [Yersinia pseudotuberculosis]
MIPEGWLISTLDKFIDIKHGFAFKSDYFRSEGEYILTTPGHFFEVGGFRDQGNKTKYYVGEVPKGYLLKKGDVLLAMTEQAAGLLGSAIYVPESGKYLHNQRLGLVIVRDDERICKEYIYLIYNSPTTRKTIAEQASGTKVKHTSPSRLLGVKVLIPPLSEQKKIAQVLSTWDKAIATTEQLLANSQLQKKALMQQLLTGKKRFPGFSEEWTEVHLSDLCFINPSRSEKPENGVVSFISMDGVSEDAKLIKTEDRYYSDVSKGFTSFKDDDVLVAKITPCFENGKGAYVINLTNGIGFGSTEFHVLRAKEGVNAKYIYYLTVMTEFRVRGEMNMQGSAGQKRVTTDYLKSLKLTVPISFTEQNKIATVLTVSDQEIATLKQKLNHLKQEKKALMQQLLTGKRRVKVDAA